MATMFDSYGRQARLFPGLLTIFPPLLAVLAWFPWLIVSSIGATLLTVATSCGLLYALGSWARTKGRRIEPKLLKKWGGWPTTILLRHSSELDPHTRKRYHRFLGAGLPDLPFPTADAERADPAAANAVYDSGVKWLREQTRGKDFPMVNRENAQYGFRRNLLGLKPIGILICLLVLLASLAAVAYTTPGAVRLLGTHNWPGIVTAFGRLGPAVLSALAINVVAIFVWSLVVTKRWVREGGFQYATALLASCDKAPAPAPDG
ncbi:membrane protein [Mesorhizobium sp. LNHC209A00]|nr:membrane protein [Mesorhizobium sp. LNHC209A00]